MASQEEIRINRIEKIKILKERGVDPYPVTSSRDMEMGEAVENFTKLCDAGKPLCLTGRVRAIRGHGGVVFFDIDDGTGKLQGYLKKDDVGDSIFNLFADTADIGDFLQICGLPLLTKRGEKSIAVSSWKMLGKSLRALPDKWHGLSDVDERFRKRYLDLLMSPEVKERFVLRSRIVAEIRAFLNKAGYMEVETPVFQPIAGGATAEPFVTHHNALDMDLFLRIAPELYLKKLLVGGFNKVYEVTRNFRNEGIDMTHNPEFTAVEFYESYSDAASQRAFIEKLFKLLVKKVYGKTEFVYDGKTINMAKKFAVVSYYDLLKRYAFVAKPESATREELSLKAKQLGAAVSEGDSIEKLMDSIYKKVCRPELIQPTFIVDYPVNYLPLAKKLPGNETLVDAFQLVVGGVELVKAFSELNDPIDQAERFKEQEKCREAGDKEAQCNDADFIEALEYGMPPAGGVGIGIDRLVMVLTDTKNIKEVILFPVMRPKE